MYINGLAVRSIVHQFVEVLFDLVSLSFPPLLCVIVDVRLKVGTGRKADGAVHFDELHLAVEVESDELAVHDVFPLRKERAHELAINGQAALKYLA